MKYEIKIGKDIAKLYQKEQAYFKNVHQVICKVVPSFRRNLSSFLKHEFNHILLNQGLQLDIGNTSEQALLSPAFSQW